MKQATTAGGVGRLAALRVAGAGARVRVVARALPSPGPKARRRLLLVLLAALLLAGLYRFWIRDAPFASVNQVSVTGLSTDDAKRVRTALVSTARTMTTLHVQRDRLEEVVQGYPVVRALEIRTDFPHGMTIRVIEHRAVAIALTAGGRVPVAADGTVLEGLPVDGPLPVVRSKAPQKGSRLGGFAALGAARIAGAAPAPLVRRLREIERDGDRGFVVHLRKGPDLVFGSAERLRAKWIASARVLADADSQGGTYVDVRVPERPAVGGLGFQVTEPELPAPPIADTLGEDGAPAEQGEVAGETAASPTAAAEPTTTSPEPSVGADGGAATAPTQ